MSKVRVTGFPRDVGRLAPKPVAAEDECHLPGSGDDGGDEERQFTAAEIAEVDAWCAEHDALEKQRATAAVTVEAPVVPDEIDDEDDEEPLSEYGGFDDDDDDDDDYLMWDIINDGSEPAVLSRPLPPPDPPVPTVMFRVIAPAVAQSIPDDVAEVLAEESEPENDKSGFTQAPDEDLDAPEMKTPLSAPARPVPTVMHSTPSKPAPARLGLRLPGGKLRWPRS